MSALLTGFFGALLGIASNIGLEWYRRISDARALAAAISAEIDATIKLYGLRGHDRTFTQMLKTLQSGVDVQIPDIIGDVETDVVIRANLERIGLLGNELSSLIATYLARLDGIRIDIKRFASPNCKASIPEKIGFIQEDLLLWESTKAQGMLAVGRLREFADRSSLDHLFDVFRSVFREQKARFRNSAHV